MDIVGKTLEFSDLDTLGTLFSSSFNLDGTCTHSNQPVGTYTVHGLTVKQSNYDGERMVLTFTSSDPQVGDMFEAMGEDENCASVGLRLKITAVNSTLGPAAVTPSSRHAPGTALVSVPSALCGVTFSRKTWTRFGRRISCNDNGECTFQVEKTLLVMLLNMDTPDGPVSSR